MSADNWATCPKCVLAEEAVYRAKKAEIEAMYGQVPAEEFLTAQKGLKDFEPEGNRDFREDYEFYNDNRGTVQVGYHGQCTSCGLEHSFETTLDLTEGVK